MKKVVITLLVLILFLSLSAPAYAGDLDLVYDEVGLLSENQLIILNEKAKTITERFTCDIAVVIVKSIGNKDVTDYAMDFYEEHNYGNGAQKSGTMLLLSMEDRDYSLISYGFANVAFTDYGKKVLLDEYILPELKNNNYYEAFDIFFDVSTEYLSKARNGEPFDIKTDPSRVAVKNIPIGITVIGLISFVISLIINLIWKSQMKSAVFQKSANSYVLPNSLHLTASNDVFIRQSIVTIPLQTSSSGGGGTTINSRGFSSRSGKF